jgi:hypothetical protein
MYLLDGLETARLTPFLAITNTTVNITANSFMVANTIVAILL